MARQLMQRMSLLLKPQPHQPQVLKPALSCYVNSLFIKSVAQSRMFCKHVDIVDHTCKISNYDEYLMNYKPVQRILKNTLVEILGISRMEINKIVEDYPQLRKRSRANILNNYYNLIEAGVQKSTVINNVWLLAHENNKLIDKLDCLKVLNMDNNQLVPWLCLTQEELANYVLYTQQDMDSYTYNRMEYLSHKLQCSIQRLCEVTVLNSFLMKIPVSSIDKKLNILHEYNVSNNDILKDVWVLRYSENHIRHRCELYKDTGQLKIKTWAIRCPLKVISRAIQKNKVERSLMQQCENVSEYLQNKLKVDEETLNSAAKKVPGVFRVNIAKLDQLINILHQNGITSDEILRHARVFYFNIETVQNRIEMLKKEGLLPNLAVLTQAERVFEHHIEMSNLRRKLLQEHGSVKNFLLDQLDVDKKLLEEVITKHPSILRVKFKKVIELIDVLRQNGITGNDIITHPRVFYFNTETLRKRIQILKEAGIPLRISLILRNRRTLDRYKLRSQNSKNINT
ncbi:transcription termination factor, mitochondrial-like [Temnothorax americanus]|uniref:transcription termination factor, mitochondrial-like n=1 Tax=Temnothorax americanus TaxID=1964332 RepID=UPI004067B540